MSQSAAPNPQADADRLEAAADEAIEVCGGNVRKALKALIVANEFLESKVSELMKVSHAYVRGRFSSPRTPSPSSHPATQFCVRGNRKSYSAKPDFRPSQFG
jgi:hypothetical protein